MTHPDVLGIPFTQYLQPDGRMIGQWIRRPPEIRALAEALRRAGATFCSEVLTTGDASFTCEHGGECLAVEVVPNGPEVPAAVDRLIRRAHLRLFSELAEDAHEYDASLTAEDDGRRTWQGPE